MTSFYSFYMCLTLKRLGAQCFINWVSNNFVDGEKVVYCLVAMSLGSSDITNIVIQSTLVI